jgi:hypothetical protein
MAADVHHLLRQLINADPAAADGLMRQARTASEPLVLVAAALAEPAEGDLLVRALRMATSPRDRQVIAIAEAFLAGQTDQVQALAREHLVDHPGSVLVAWLAASTPPSAAAGGSLRPHPDHLEES